MESGEIDERKEEKRQREGKEQKDSSELRKSKGEGDGRQTVIGTFFFQLLPSGISLCPSMPISHFWKWSTGVTPSKFTESHQCPFP